MTAAEFADLMPHRIRVKGTVELDDFGYPVATGAVKEYRCLLDDSVTVNFAQRAVEVSPTHVAYVMPFALTVDGDFEPTASIITSDSVIITPDDVEHEITSVLTHYDETGLPHNQEVRFN